MPGPSQGIRGARLTALWDVRNAQKTSKPPARRPSRAPYIRRTPLAGIVPVSRSRRGWASGGQLTPNCVAAKRTDTPEQQVSSSFGWSDRLARGAGRGRPGRPCDGSFCSTTGPRRSMRVRGRGSACRRHNGPGRARATAGSASIGSMMSPMFGPMEMRKQRVMLSPRVMEAAATGPGLLQHELRCGLR